MAGTGSMCAYKRPRRHLAVAFVAVGVVGLAGCGSGSDGGGGGQVTLRYASSTAPGGGQYAAEQWWVEQVEKRSKGRIDVQLEQSSALLPVDETLAGVEDGRADIGYIPTSFYGAEFPLYAVADIPFLTADSQAHAAALTELAKNNKFLSEEFAKRDLQPLFFLPIGPSALAVREPIEHLQDLSGKRIRAFGQVADAFKAVGADIANVTTDELYNSLERGVIDGSVSTFDANISFGVHEVAPNFVDFGGGVNIGVGVFMNADVWQGLDSDLQQVMADVTADLLPTAMDQMRPLEDKACATLRDAHGTVTIFGEDVVADWRDLVEEDFNAAWKKRATDAGLSQDDADAYLDEFTGYLEKESTGTPNTVFSRCAKTLASSPAGR